VKQTIDGQEKPFDLLSSTDRYFRPVDPLIGPDGAVWFGDWANALIGHMQYSQRDPNRDQTHGRIYRMVNKDKPLLTPVLQYGKSEAELLDQLREYEPRVRYRARTELRDRPADKVTAAVKTWLAGLKPGERDYDRLTTEALWVQQSFHRVDDALVQQVLKAKMPQARAAAVHVLTEERDYLSGAFGYLKAAVADENPRVRVEALRGLSFFPTVDSIDAALTVLEAPADYWVSYTLQHTLGALQNVWEPAAKAGTLSKGYPKGVKFVEDYLFANKPGAKAQQIMEKLLSTKATSQRQQATDEILAIRGNPENGKQVFSRSCRNCHMVGNEGFELGPALTDVATRLKAHDIVESIIDPNAKLDQKYLATLILTDEGVLFNGLVSAETEKTVTMRVAGKVVEIAKDSIEERRVMKQSSMPEALAAGLAPLDFVDLLEYLRTLQKK
ncbi:MAG: DUF7133 domain-containing protein, partial [Planctomycetia bacterium]